jgi:hypothetical protein
MRRTWPTRGGGAVLLKEKENSFLYDVARMIVLKLE